MRYLYSFFFTLLTPFILLRLLWRSRETPEYRRRWPERFGRVKPLSKPVIWIHAVSVGEVLATPPLVQALKTQYPGHQVLITTMTPTGAEQVKKQLGDLVTHYYVPYDLPCAIQSFLKRIQPEILIVIETELWPNLLHYTNARQIPIILANARLSPRSYQRYQKIHFVVKPMLEKITTVIAQSVLDAERFLALGLPQEKLVVTGNIKFDMSISDEVIQQGKMLKKTWQPRLAWLGASTHEGEESIILDIFISIKKRYPNLLLILVPRHPNRFDKVAEYCTQRGFKVSRRSYQEAVHPETDIYLADTMGELRLLYAASDIVFVGGSLVPIGGHNLIEPAAFELPIISGQYLHNFTLVSELLLAAQALRLVSTPHELMNALDQLLENPSLREQMGKAAYQVFLANKGAVEKHLVVVRSLLK